MTKFYQMTEAKIPSVMSFVLPIWMQTPHSIYTPVSNEVYRKIRRSINGIVDRISLGMEE